MGQSGCLLGALPLVQSAELARFDRDDDGIGPVSAIFISHSSRDDTWALRIRDWLLDEQEQRPQEQRFRSLFLDFDPDDGINAGERWRDQLFEHLHLCAAVIVICSEAYAASQWCLAELGVAMASGKLVLPVRIEAGNPLPKLLSETQATALAVIDLEQGAAAGWDRLLKGLEPLSWQNRLPWPPPGEPGASPFPGLDTFERRHAAVFYGQDAVRRQLQATINLLPQRQSRLLLILGASGCGKSSLLRAGLVPGLAEADRRRWIVLEPFRPGKKPFDWLHQVLSERFRAVGGILEGEPALTEQQLSDQLEDLRRLSGQQDARVVIPIDQFEELLGRGDDRDPEVSAAADAFLGLLAELLAKEGSQVLIIATLRSDFYGQLQLHPSGLHRLAGQPVPLGPLDQAGFRQVIEGPARRVGLRLELGLSDALVGDTATGDALPLLAFTLQELWEGRVAGDGLTLKQYEDFGRLAGAVQRKADEVLASSGADDGEIAALEEAFVGHLIRLTSDGQAAKQPARRSALPAASRRLVDLFVAARLLVAGKGADRDQVEIAHEALLRTWPTLVQWIDAGRGELLQRLRVRRLGEDLSAYAPERQRRQALEQLAALAAAGGGEERALQKEATEPLSQLLANELCPLADREDAALVLALIGAEEPLQLCLANQEAPPTLRRRAAESLGLLARRCGRTDPHAIEQRKRIEAKLDGWLRSEVLDVRIEVELDPATLDPAMVQGLVEQTQRQVAERMQQMMQAGQLPEELGQDQLREIYEQYVNRIVVEQLQQRLWRSGQAPGWKEHDERLPLLQGASRGLQLAASAELPLFGAGPGRVVPMLTLTALEEGNSLRIRTEVVEVPVWQLPLPGGEQLELVAVPAGDYTIGSPSGEEGRDLYTQFRKRCEGVDVEPLRPVQLDTFALVRHPISQRQWQAVVEGMDKQQRRGIKAAAGSFVAKGLWEKYGQPGALPVDSVSINECIEWLQAANTWFTSQWQGWSEKYPSMGDLPANVALPSESQWEAACRAGSTMPFHFGSTLDGCWARCDARHPYGRGRQGKLDQRPVPIGYFGLVNRWGLAELHGQLQEPCANQWHPDPQMGELLDEGLIAFRDPTTIPPPTELGMRLLRGGAWSGTPRMCRSALRFSNVPTFGTTDAGQRPCCLFPSDSLLGA